MVVKYNSRHSVRPNVVKALCSSFIGKGLKKEGHNLLMKNVMNETFPSFILICAHHAVGSLLKYNLILAAGGQAQHLLKSVAPSAYV